VYRKSMRLVAPVIVLAALIGGVASGFAASRGHQSSSVLKTYRVSATLKGTGVSGSFTGSLGANGSKGTLVWKVTLKPSTAASAVEIRAGSTSAGKLLLRLCAPCASPAHGTKIISGTALTAAVAGHAGVVVHTGAHGTLSGSAKATPSSSQGGGLTITPTPALVAKGKSLTANRSCGGCHTIDGTKSSGPTWKGLAGSKVHLTNGKTIIATDSYLVGVITDPSTLQVSGYDPALMQSMIPPGSISEAQAEAIVAYIKTLK
jgi:cytochrome c2